MNEVPYTLEEIKDKALIIERKYDASLGEPVDVAPGADYATRLMSELIDEISVVFDRIAAVLCGDFVTPAPQGTLFNQTHTTEEPRG